ncbi:protein of unknown function [Cupriavidus neocaledonicus]|uniref:Uncharacterized protein n=1 Tax=Cupriavidus neocaledonicus TaxID=1040979 RepID=A0A375H9N3_9BURK|nr:exported hypothetical protein [Cupriavidus neocaledonicus]SPD46900.1 protein of unknown function [Cupriavidus neocaledonicus]
MNGVDWLASVSTGPAIVAAAMAAPAMPDGAVRAFGRRLTRVRGAVPAAVAGAQVMSAAADIRSDNEKTIIRGAHAETHWVGAIAGRDVRRQAGRALDQPPVLARALPGRQRGAGAADPLGGRA